MTTAVANAEARSTRPVFIGYRRPCGCVHVEEQHRALMESVVCAACSGVAVEPVPPAEWNYDRDVQLTLAHRAGVAKMKAQDHDPHPCNIVWTAVFIEASNWLMMPRDRVARYKDLVPLKHYPCGCIAAERESWSDSQPSEHYQYAQCDAVRALGVTAARHGSRCRQCLFYSVFTRVQVRIPKFEALLQYGDDGYNVFSEQQSLVVTNCAAHQHCDHSTCNPPDH